MLFPGKVSVKTGLEASLHLIWIRALTVSTIPLFFTHSTLAAKVYKELYFPLEFLNWLKKVIFQRCLPLCNNKLISCFSLANADHFNRTHP